MKLVIFSDIHGNSYALNAFIRKLQMIEYDRLIFCGDIFGYYYNQKDTIKSLKELRDLTWIKGNHDAYFMKAYGDTTLEHQYISKYGHSYHGLKEKFDNSDTNWFGMLKPSYAMEEQGCKIGIFHGTPDDPLEGRLYSNTDITDETLYRKYDIVLLGHTHCRMIRNVNDTLIVNSGSLGQPRDGNGYGFAVLDTDRKSVSFENVYFDEQKLYRQIDKYDKNLKKLKDVLERKNNETGFGNSY